VKRKSLLLGVTLERVGDVEQTMRPNLLNNIKAWIQLEPLITYESGT